MSGAPVPTAADADPASQRAAGEGKRRSPPRLPPLNLFRTFECAARHGSFRLAAAELCVTPSAVSQQIRQLEDYLGVRLFRRLPRRVELTRDGMRLGTSVKEAIAGLSAACESISAADAPTMICVNAAQALASRWLVARLKGFMEAHPNIRVMLQAAGVSGVAFKDILYFSDASLMLEAAAQGQGICLATTLLAQADLQSGRLVRPFATELAPAEGYYLLVDARHGERPAVAAFRAWIREEARQTLSGVPRYRH